MVVRVKPRMSPRTKLSGLIRQRKHNTFLRLRVRNVDISTQYQSEPTEVAKILHMHPPYGKQKNKKQSSQPSDG